jgi:hypothetical protein
MTRLKNARFVAGFISASLIFGSTAVALNVNNTPEGGYLLCYNQTTKAVTFPGQLKCPKGTRPLELGAKGEDGADGVDGFDGLSGRDGRDGRDGKDGSNSLTHNAYVKSQDVVVTDTTKGKRVVVLKASDLVGGSAITGNYLFEADVSVYFPSSTTSSSNRWAYCAWRDAKDWSTSSDIYGHGDNAQIYGTIFTSATLRMRAVLNVSPLSDKYLTCTLYGTGQITGGFVTAQETRGSFKDTLGA